MNPGLGGPVARGRADVLAGRQTEGERSLATELARERAEAAGRAGRRLDDAIAALAEAEQATTGSRLDPVEEDQLLRTVRDAVYALVVQRECLGFRHDNLRWIRATYDVPAAVLRRL